MSLDNLVRTPIADTQTGLMTAPWQRAVREGSIFSGSVNGGVLNVVSSPTPVFDAQSENPAYFEYGLTQATLSSSIVGTFAGQVVVFGFFQDSTGWPFVWPGNVKNAEAVPQTPGAKAFQMFVVSTDGNLYPIAPMTIN